MQEFKIKLQQTVEHTHAPVAKVVVFTEPPRLNANSVNENLRKQSLGLTTEKIYADKKSHLERIQRIFYLIDQAGIDYRCLIFL